MANKFPYIASSGPLNQMVAQFKKSFPPFVDADILKKLAIAPKNESYLINILRFLALTDEENKRTASAAKVFSLHDDAQFAAGFGELVHKAYKDFFDLRGEGGWTLDQNSLISFFRQSDQSSAIVGQRQATTFQTLAVISGKREATANSSLKSSSKSPSKPAAKKAKPAEAKKIDVHVGAADASGKSQLTSNVGLTVRIEVNLPSQGDQEVYDRIFKSIRANLIEG